MKTTFTHLPFQRFLKAIKAFSFLFLFFFLAHSALGQTSKISFSLIKAPCNNDGILVIKTTGLTAPIVFRIYESSINFNDTLNNVNDTLYNYSGSYVYVGVVATGGTSSSAEYAGRPPIHYNVLSTPAVCPALGSLKAIVDSGTAPYIVQWFAQGDNTNVVATGDSVGLKAGNYSIQITDAKGCVVNYFAPASPSSGTNGGYDSISVRNSFSLHYSVSNTSANCTNGTLSISGVSGGQTPYTYLWNNGANIPSISGLVYGQYTFTITDANGCFRDSTVSLTQSVKITVTSTPTNATCVQNNGSAIAFGAGGVSPYTYLWKTGAQTQSISNLTSGTYLVTVTDSRGCIGVGYAPITSSTPITVTYSTTTSSCTSATGSATLNITGGQTPYVIDWYTFPSQNTNTATALSPGIYSFKVTDANNCVRTGSTYVPPVSVVSAAIFKSDAVCTQSNGGANVVVASGAKPLTYQWSTGATGSSISGLPPGGYSCTITDNMNCAVYKSVSVGSSSPINLAFTSTQASCLFNSDATITAVVSGGTTPYNYNWTNGQTTVTATGLVQGKYYAYVTDAAGCVQNGYTSVGYDSSNHSCYCTITGTVYLDSNKNCSRDAGEPGIQNIMIHLKGVGYTYTDQNGNYSFLAPTGTYTLTENVEYYYPLASCQNNDIPVSVTASSGCVSTYNFANVVNPIHDISICTASNGLPPIPGFTYQQTVIIKNNGSVTEDSILSIYANDGQLSTASFVPSLFTQQTPSYYSVTPGALSLAPGASQVLSVYYNVPTNIPLGTTINYNDTVAYKAPVANWLNDYSPWNNVNAYQNVVVGSFDPNYKEVTPIGTGVQGLIPVTDSVLTYTIHFQNAGTYMAQKVVLIDTLDPHLDITTVQPGYSNYNYAATLSEKGVLTFTFNNIDLPDSSTSEVGSACNVSYTVHQKAGNTPGTQITSPASVYFDYNQPVKTNATINTIEDVATGVKEHAANVFDLTVYPNPVSGNKVGLLINTNTSSTSSTVDIYDLLGKLVQSKTVTLNAGKNLVNADVSKLTPGLYFVKVNEGQKSLVQKMTVVK